MQQRQIKLEVWRRKLNMEHPQQHQKRHHTASGLHCRSDIEVVIHEILLNIQRYTCISLYMSECWSVDIIHQCVCKWFTMLFLPINVKCQISQPTDCIVYTFVACFKWHVASGNRWRACTCIPRKFLTIKRTRSAVAVAACYCYCYCCCCVSVALHVATCSLQLQEQVHLTYLPCVCVCLSLSLSLYPV